MSDRQALTAGEAAKLKEITHLAGDTVALAAPGGCRVLVRVGPHARGYTADIHPAAAGETSLVLGGKGNNIKNVRELAGFAAPCGCTVELDIPTPAPSDRRPVTIARQTELSHLAAERITRMLEDWHKVLGGTIAPPRIRIESTASADVFIVSTRDLPSAAMGALRRIVGWACYVRGRIGFLEWEAPGH